MLEPMAVAEPEIGQYGGTARVFALDNLAWGDLLEQPERGSSLLRMREDGEIVPDLVRGYKVSDDEKTFTFYLRKGMKWSDGYPFTADDFLFKYEDMGWNDKVETWWDSSEPLKEIKKIDDYTVRFEFKEPYPKFLLTLVDWRGSEWMRFAPKHYLKKWHIKYNPEADKLAKEEGYGHWWEAFNHHQEVAPAGDINKPTVQPWMFKEFTTTYRIFERNPYFYAVDQAGNQLPYIDKIVSTIVDPEVYQMKIISGETDVAFGNTSLENYPLYKENEDKGYRTVLLPGINGSEVGYSIYQNHQNPVLRKIFQDVRFRQALSLAINREEINDTVYFGLGVPRQATVLPSCRYYKEEWGKTYIRYKPDEANRLLDEMGLTERGKDGFRIGSDGKTVLLIIEHTTGLEGTSATVHELVKEYWEDVGLRVLLKPEGYSLFDTRSLSPDHEINAVSMSNSQEFYNYMSGGFWVPGDHLWSTCWGAWLIAEEDIRRGRKTLADFEGEKLPGEEPPEEIKFLSYISTLRGESRYGSEEYMDLSKDIYNFHAKRLYLIGTVGLAPTCFIANKNLGNVPTRYFPTAEENFSLNYLAKFLFFKQ
ncbi:MAG: hypothetical protein GH145_00885 [Firmicutes bacterium]|nr:hypothetical protein [Bacillota bacterium]